MPCFVERNLSGIFTGFAKTLQSDVNKNVNDSTINIIGVSVTKYRGYKVIFMLQFRFEPREYCLMLQVAEVQITFLSILAYAQGGRTMSPKRLEALFPVASAP